MLGNYKRRAVWCRGKARESVNQETLKHIESDFIKINTKQNRERLDSSWEN